MLGKAGFVAIAVISAGVGAHSLNPRELYNEMYPVETLKRDAFHLCNEADPTFVRAVKVDREACYDSMPHTIEVALGRIRPGGALSMTQLLDPSRQAELLLQIAALPPRQPITVPRSFANTEWARALSPDCGTAPQHPPEAVALASPGLPPPPGSGRAAALDTAMLGNLPPLAHGEPAIASRATPLAPGAAVPTFDPLPSPDVGDQGQPAIVPLAPASACGA